MATATHTQSRLAGKEFARPGDFLALVRQAAEAGHVPAALRPYAAGGDEQGSHTNPLGAFLVPESVAPVMLSMPVIDPIGARVRPIPMASEMTTVPARVDKDHATSVTGGIDVRRIAQTQPADPSRMEMEAIVLIAHELVGAVFATSRVATYSALAFAALIESAFRDESAATLLRERIHGNGVAEFEGILSADCTITIDPEGAQTATEYDPANIEKMAGQCWQYASAAVWLAHPDAFLPLTRLISPIGSAGERMFVFPQREGDPFMLFGRPLFFTEECSPVGERGDLICGVWSEYLQGTLQSGTDVSLHVRYLNREVAYQFFILNDGKCWWRVPATLRHSETQVSPFVVLGDR